MDDEQREQWDKVVELAFTVQPDESVDVLSHVILAAEEAISGNAGRGPTKIDFGLMILGFVVGVFVGGMGIAALLIR